MALDPTPTALGAWSGGRFLHFGEPLDDDRLTALLRPGDGIDTVITADVYGQGEGDRLVGRALTGRGRESYSLVGAIGHDFYDGERQGAKGFPRFTATVPRERWTTYVREATERSLERCGVDQFDLLLLHNPDRAGYSDPRVWEALEAVRESGLTRKLGIAPGPANGFTVDLIDSFERFGSSIDWAMIILSPMEPWPGELVLDAAAAHDVQTITRVADYGGLFWDDVRPGHHFREQDHRLFRPKGWIDRGAERLELMRPIAQRHGLTVMQLACQWNLAHPTVGCVAPSLIQEAGDDARTVESKRAELAAVSAEIVLTADEIEQLAAIGDNTNSMALKGGSVEHDGDPLPDRWSIDDDLEQVAGRWSIDPGRDLVKSD
jgi:aryl-alcohol dehydrogenase-like predicted oxidoreductase